ncbi:MAG: hypothetical protein JWR44_1326 [Hymenobacter sp.]|nr:hypothetical protein [Hymenobacter sp.]
MATRRPAGMHDQRKATKTGGLATSRGRFISLNQHQNTVSERGSDATQTGHLNLTFLVPNYWPFG